MRNYQESTDLLTQETTFPTPECSLEIARIICSSKDATVSRPRVPGLVIDQQGSKDRDDAFWVEKLSNGGYRAYVTIASVGEFIPEGSALDRDARDKGFTLYDRGRALIPMLPRELSEDALSLIYGQLRPTLTIGISLAPDLEIDTVVLAKTSFLNDQELSYDSAASILRNPQHPTYGVLNAASELAGLLQERRVGKSRRQNRKKSATVHTIIEEFMLLGNRAVSRYALENRIPIIFRNHPNMYGDTDAPPFCTTESAYYSSINRGHKGLKLDSYDQVTSPLRRYPDLHNQRLFIAHLEGQDDFSPDNTHTLSQLLNTVEFSQRRRRRKKAS